ncbi:MAG: DUF1318 domain-containing protein [Candidatus Omnitrophica bacterium]|nr:DUF1318 domain-containing protein [Candidatus Omnitrophota bacterium]
MKKIMLLAIVIGVVGLGCASVQVKAPKDPIKVDIAMRVDVYQHVEKDIDSIENIVSGNSPAAAVQNKPVSMLDCLMADAYAEDIQTKIEQLALKRRDRYSALTQAEAKGIIGENKAGLVEIRGSGDSSAGQLVQAENADRQGIYNLVAEKNGTSVSDVQKLYAKRLQSDAPQGTPIETGSGWTTK